MQNFCWKKLGKVFDPTEWRGPDWMQVYAQAPATLLFDEFVRVYFSCRPKPDNRGQYVSYTGFVDLDRRNLFHILRVSQIPILDLGGLGMFDEFGVYPISVIRNGTDILAYYGGWTRCESVPFNVAIGMARSKDGEVFTRTGTGPVLSYSIDEPFILSGPKVRRYRGKTYLFYISGREWILDAGKPEPVYKIRMAESEDGYIWRKLGRDIIADSLGEHEAQASPDVIELDSTFHMFFSYRHGSDYRNAARGYRIGHAYSNNLLDWQRDDTNVGIGVSAKGWDSESISYPHVFELDGRVFMLYLGNEVGKHGFGLAELERSS